MSSVDHLELDSHIVHLDMFLDGTVGRGFLCTRVHESTSVQQLLKNETYYNSTVG